MFNNNIKGNNNKIQIKQTKGEGNSISVQLIVGITVTVVGSVVGGIILFLLIGA